MFNIYQYPLSTSVQGAVLTLSLAALLTGLWQMTRARSQRPDTLLELAHLSRSPSPEPPAHNSLYNRSSQQNPSTTPPNEFPRVAITGGRQSISITLAEHITTANAFTSKQQYRILSRRLLPTGVPSWAFEVTAEIAGKNWSTENLRIVGEELNRLREEVGVERWKKLTILLPSVELPPNTAKQVVVALPNLQSLVWSGHRQQLPQWSFFTRPASLSWLRSLTLRCEMSTDDCAVLLFHGALALEYFEVDSLADVDAVLPKVSDAVSMASLESLIISSSGTTSIGPFLAQFRFPKLRKINFTLPRQKPDFGYDFPTIKWSKLEEVRLQCEMDPLTSRSIRACCTSAIVHSHTMKKSLASFPEPELEPAVSTTMEILEQLEALTIKMDSNNGNFPPVRPRRKVVDLVR